MKFPFSFGIRLIFRLLLPGLILSSIAMPLLFAAFKYISVPFDPLIYLPLAAIGLGWLIMLLDMPIYMLFEGRRFWPTPLWKWALACERQRLDKLIQRMDSAREQPERSRYLEAAVKTTEFPLDSEGNREVQSPTRLGNIIAEYEGYPKVKYGMDGVFYWYRIWVGLPKDMRAEIDEYQSLVDSAIYISFTLFFSAFVLTSYVIFDVVTTIRLLPTVPLWGKCAGVPLLIGTGYAIYRFSLPAHTQYGQFFKAIFDRFHTSIEREPVLNIIAEMTGDDRLKLLQGREANIAVWRFLQWNRVRLPGENKNQNIANIQLTKNKKNTS